VRDWPAGKGGCNAFIDAWYAEHGASLSLDSLREQARRNYEGRIGKVAAALERLREKEAEFANAESLREEGDRIMAALGEDNVGADVAAAQQFYERYRKAKSGLDGLRREIADSEAELARLETKLAELLAEENPLRLARLVRAGGEHDPEKARAGKNESPRPGLAYRSGDWLILVGRSAAENDELLRRWVKGNDLWLHARDWAGSYVFVKRQGGQRDARKSIPLETLLDAGNLALFYSKGRSNGGGDLYYTPVKYLRRAKNGPRGLVLPTQEKNLTVKLDETRLRRLERSKE
jgi:predicted ribosome quality control (RQC) complex YloA/Tae2 family protein